MGTKTRLLPGCRVGRVEEVDFGGAIRVGMDVDMEERFPRRIDREAAEPWLVRVQVGAPADDHLAGVEYDPVQHSAGSTHTGFVHVSDEREDLGFAHERSSCLEGMRTDDATSGPMPSDAVPGSATSLNRRKKEGYGVECPGRNSGPDEPVYSALFTRFPGCMMSDQAYLEAILRDQTLANDSPEMQLLRNHREEVEAHLRSEFAGANPTIRYGGSKAKGTMIRESYDLDIPCYFPRDDADAGSTLREIYENAAKALGKKYWVQPKGSALRLLGLESRVDFHIDVVPGRFVDGESGDVFLYRSTGEKQRLKTNLDTHIAHVRESGVVPAIRLMKLWSTRCAIGMKTFALELLVVKLLEGSRDSLPDQLRFLWTEFTHRSETLSVEDPANPQGNDLSDLLGPSVRTILSSASDATLRMISANGWESVFGPVQKVSGDGPDQAAAAKLASLRTIAANIPVPTRPYRSE